MSEPKFSKRLGVRRTRSHGRTDHDIVEATFGPSIAKLRSGAAVEYAFLFAAAPALYDACVAALPALKAAGADELVAKIEAALKKSRPPTE